MLILDDIVREYTKAIKKVNLKNPNSFIIGMWDKAGMIANDISIILEYYRDKVEDSKVQNILFRIYDSAKSLNKLAKIGIRFDLPLCSGRFRCNIIEYLKNYVMKVNEVSSSYNDIKINISDLNIDNKVFFDLVELAVIMDYIVDNSKEAGAKNINITYEMNDEYLFLHFKDDGKGLDGKFKDEDLFLLGTSSYGYAGIGLYHIKDMMDGIDGKVFINKNIDKGFDLVLGFPLVKE